MKKIVALVFGSFALVAGLGLFGLAIAIQNDPMTLTNHSSSNLVSEVKVQPVENSVAVLETKNTPASTEILLSEVVIRGGASEIGAAFPKQKTSCTERYRMLSMGSGGVLETICK